MCVTFDSSFLLHFSELHQFSSINFPVGQERHRETTSSLCPSCKFNRLTMEKHLRPRSNGNAIACSAVNFKKKKHATLSSFTPEPAIWSCDTGQRIPCFDSCQFTITWLFNIKDLSRLPHSFLVNQGGRRLSPPTPAWVALGLPSSSPRVCRRARAYAYSITKLFRLHRFPPNFLTHGAPLPSASWF